jgi:hypothetical protein
MAVIGTIESTFLAPGWSRNRRLYTPELIEKAVARMQERLADVDGLPLTILSHHAAEDDSKELVGRIVSCSLNPDTYEASLSGYLIDTRAGLDIAAATTPDAEGKRVLDAMSIRGWWLGPVRNVEQDGITGTTGDDLEVDGVDFTRSPGVLAARITAASAAATESAGGRTPITESVEALMSDSTLVHSTSSPTPKAVPPKPGSPAAAARAAEQHVETAPTEQPTPPVTSPDTSPVTEPATPPVAETTPDRASGLVRQLVEAYIEVGGWQGPIDLDLSAWGVSNDDVAQVAAQLGAAYQTALQVLNPDNIPTCPGCMAEVPMGAAYCPACGAALTPQETAPTAAAADTKESTVSDTTATPATTEQAAPAAGATTTEDATPATPETPAGPALTTADHEAIAALLASKLAPPPAAPAEAAPAAPAPAVEATPATPAAPAAAPAGLTAEQITAAVAAAATEAVTALRADIVKTYGPPTRKGLVEAATAATAKPLHDMTPEEFQAHAAQAWTAVLDPTS